MMKVKKSIKENKFKFSFVLVVLFSIILTPIILINFQPISSPTPQVPYIPSEVVFTSYATSNEVGRFEITEIKSNEWKILCLGTGWSTTGVWVDFALTLTIDTSIKDLTINLTKGDDFSAWNPIVEFYGTRDDGSHCKVVSGTYGFTEYIVAIRNTGIIKLTKVRVALKWGYRSGINHYILFEMDTETR